MSRLFFKILFASLLAGLWRGLDTDSPHWVTLAIFVFVLIVLTMNPIKFQSPQKREEYIRKMRESKERKALIASKQKEERMRLKREKQEREEQLKRGFYAKMKRKE